MSTRYVALAVAMFAVTYPGRAVPLLTLGAQRLPKWALDYLRLVGPAVLASLATTAALVVTTSSGPRLQVDVTAVSVLAGVAVVARRRNLLLGLAVAVALAAVGRAMGLGVLTAHG
jgi:branched-subunit amino acid transport protein